MKRLVELLIFAIATFLLVPNPSFAASKKEEKQAEVRKAANQRLTFDDDPAAFASVLAKEAK